MSFFWFCRVAALLRLYFFLKTRFLDFLFYLNPWNRWEGYFVIRDNFAYFSIKICCQGDSNKYPQHVLMENYKKLSFNYHTLICFTMCFIRYEVYEHSTGWCTTTGPTRWCTTTGPTGWFSTTCPYAKTGPHPSCAPAWAQHWSPNNIAARQWWYRRGRVRTTVCTDAEKYVADRKSGNALVIYNHHPPSPGE